MIHYDGENGRPFKPCKTVRKIIIFAWGDDGTKWIGRSITLFNDPDVKWAGVKVGGIRVSHMSHIEKDIQLQLTATRGKKEPFIIKRLAVTEPPPIDLDNLKMRLNHQANLGTEALITLWKELTQNERNALGGKCPQEYKDMAAKADAPPPVVIAPDNQADDIGAQTETDTNNLQDEIF